MSLAYVLPLGADDLDKVIAPLAFRYARDGDTFVDMADGGEAGAGVGGGAEVEAGRPQGVAEVAEVGVGEALRR